MKSRKHPLRVAAVVTGFGLLFAGPCGITPLQFNDFLTSTAIRLAVSAAASLVEVSLIEQTGSPQTQAPQTQVIPMRP